jgi:NADH:ubiquinone reductase (non-electrogenic)
MKKRIVVLGTGFAAFRFLKKINTKLYDVSVISPRNHFLFTPLLPETTVGSVEFRSIIEPVRNIKGIKYQQSYCMNIDAANKYVLCRDSDTQKEYRIDFDYLIIAVGEITNTFGIEGINENALFLKELADARQIRTKVIDCFENASLPNISQEEKRRFLRFAVCGGGPTGVEFAAELHDFIEDDVKKKYKDLADYVEIILIEAGSTLLASFDKKLSDYTMKIFKRQNIILKINSYVNKVDYKTIFLNDGTGFEYGLLVWATGNASTPLVSNSELMRNVRGKIITDRFFRVKTGQGYSDCIYAAGDCAVIEDYELPVTAQVAQNAGLYLAKLFNAGIEGTKPFAFRSFGMLAYIGGNKALADLPQYKGTGFSAFLFWRSAYLTKLVSFKNKILVLFDWVKTFLFGRDVSNF